MMQRQEVWVLSPLLAYGSNRSVSPFDFDFLYEKEMKRSCLSDFEAKKAMPDLHGIFFFGHLSKVLGRSSRNRVLSVL